MVDGVVLWKMHGRLSGTGRLHGNSQIKQYARVGTETIALNDFQFAIIIIIIIVVVTVKTSKMSIMHKIIS